MVLKKRYLFFIFGLFSLFFEAEAQKVTEEKPEDVWKVLAKVTYKQEKDEMLGFEIDVPIFSKEVKALAGKEITIRGYIIPVEGYKQQDYFVFSAYPYNLCYFCGGAGPETVMEVFTPKGKSIKYTSKPITIRGKLALNAKDVNKLMYLLEDAVLIAD